MDLRKQTDIMLFDAIEHQEESNFKLILARIASGLKNQESEIKK